MPAVSRLLRCASLSLWVCGPWWMLCSGCVTKEIRVLEPCPDAEAAADAGRDARVDTDAGSRADATVGLDGGGMQDGGGARDGAALDAEAADDAGEVESDSGEAIDGGADPRDLWNGAPVVLASVTSAGGQANGPSGRPSIDGAGRVVAFETQATNLFTATGAPKTDVVAITLGDPGSLENVSGPTGGSNASSFLPIVSSNGNAVGFFSYASNFVVGDDNRVGGDPFTGADVFVYDRATATRALVDRNTSASGTPHGETTAADLDATGRFVTFTSAAADIVTDDTNGVADVFVVDRRDGVARLVSRTPSALGNGASLAPSISADGGRVAFVTVATNLFERGDAGGIADVVVLDRATGAFRWLSHSMTGGPANGNSGVCRISANGRVVTFISNATNLVAGDTTTAADLFVYDLDTDRIERVLGAGDVEPNGPVEYTYNGPTISADGRFVAFTSSASNLVADDTNALPDVFVYDRVTRHVERVSKSREGAQANGGSSDAFISADGRSVAFTTGATNLLATADTNDAADVVVRRRAE